MVNLLTALQAFESGSAAHPERGGSNIANTHQGTSSGQAQGYNQITTGTWKEFGGLAYAPTPLQATPAQQDAIAAKIPLRRWDPKTLNYLRQSGFTLNPSATLAENIALNQGTAPAQGTSLTSVPGVVHPPHTLTPPTAGAPYTAAAVAAANPPPAAPTPEPNFLQKMFTRPEPTKDANGNEVQGKSPIEKLADNIGGTAKAGQQQTAAPEAAQFAPIQDPTAQMAGPAAQLYNTVQSAAAKPLTWSSRPYGWDSGLQMQPPGMTLNSAGYG